jgi:hypothetical protein
MGGGYAASSVSHLAGRGVAKPRQSRALPPTRSNMPSMNANGPERRSMGPADEIIELQVIVRDVPQPGHVNDDRPLFYLGKAHTTRGERWYECGAVEDRDGYLLYCRRAWRWHRGPHDFAHELNRDVRHAP